MFVHSRYALTVDKHRPPRCAVAVVRQAAQASRTSAEKFLGALTAPVHLYAHRFFSRQFNSRDHHRRFTCCYPENSAPTACLFSVLAASPIGH